MLSKLPIGVWVGTAPGGLTAYVNEAFTQLLDLTDDVLVGSELPVLTNIYDAAGEPFAEEVLPWARVIATRAPTVVDGMVVRTANGDRRHLRASGSLLSGPDGEPAHVLVSLVDVSREVEAERERDTVSARLAVAVNHAPIVLWCTDEKGVITLSEGEALTSLGFAPGQLVGQSAFDLYSWHPTVCTLLRRALDGESLNASVDVGDVPMETYLCPLKDSRGRITGMMGLSRNVRELRALQAATLQSERAVSLGLLAASVAHEVNNPLTYMLGQALCLERQFSGIAEWCENLPIEVRAEIRDRLECITECFFPLREGIERIASITRELRTFSRSDHEEQTLVDCRAAVESALRLVGKELEARAVVSLQLGQTEPVLGNHGHVVQVVLNLVMNAMQSLPSDGAAGNFVGIRTETRDGKVLMEVSDSGPGVPVAERERIFDPFVTKKGVGEGTGLGLFVCRNIVRSYGGEVSVRDGEFGGAAFVVTLPVGQGSVRPSREPEPLDVGRLDHVPLILLIDDEPHVLTAARAMLHDEGYRVICSASGSEGLAVLRSRADIDLVFCDLMMSDLTGMDLHECLAREAPLKLASVVFMTGGAYVPEARQFEHDHPDLVVQKPFDIVREVNERLSSRRN